MENPEPNIGTALTARRVATIIERHYSVGSVTRIAEIRTGPGSIAWSVETGDLDRIQKYCLKDHTLKTPDRLLAEHGLINAMRAAGCTLIPGSVPSTEGDTIVLDLDNKVVLYDFVYSDPPFDWTAGKWTAEHSYAAGQALSEFHYYSEIAARSMNLLDNESDPDRALIHGDYHPANVLFSRGDVVGIVDMDYCRIASRTLDVAYGMVLFGCSLRDKKFDAEKARLFLDGYNEKPFRTPISWTDAQEQMKSALWMVATWLGDQHLKDPSNPDLKPLLQNSVALVAEIARLS